MIRPDIQLCITKAEASLIVKALKAYRPTETCTLQDMIRNEARWAMEAHQRNEAVRTICEYVQSYINR